MGTKIRVIDQVMTWHDGDEDDSDEEFAYQGTSYEDHTITGFKVVEPNEYFSMAVPFIPQFDTDYFLVYATYSTGDSFGNSHGRIILVDLFATRAKAERCVKTMEDHHQVVAGVKKQPKGKGKNTFSSDVVKLKNESGISYPFGVPYHGYFESLSNIELQTIRRV